MTLTCKKEALDGEGKKIMQFTFGKRYDFLRLTNFDGPDEWEVEDDKGNTEIFFNPYIMFEN